MRRSVVVAALLTACGGSTVPPKAEPPSPAPATATAPPDADAATGPESAAPPPREDGRLPPGTRPVGYALDFTLDPSQKTFSGRARINVMMADPARAVVLHGRDLVIRSVTAKTSRGSVAGRATSRLAFGAKDGREEMVLDFDDEVPAGGAEIDIDYEAPFSDGLRGIYRVHEDGRDYAFTQFEAIDARRAFPCFDEPGNKTPFQLTISVPKGLLALGNMPEVARREDRPGLVTFEFDTSPPLPTYLVALAVGPLELLEGRKTPTPIRLVAVKGKSSLGKYALGVTAAHLDLLGKYFDRPYPYPKLDIVAVPDFAYGAMENAGLITFREDGLLIDPAHASTAARHEVDGDLAHELAHQWFGDLVTMQWWDDLWLNESFATWMETKILDQWKMGNSARLELLGTKSQMMAQDSLTAARPIRRSSRSASDILESNDSLTYYKGAAVLGMVEAWTGAEHFREGMRRYMKEHAWGNVTAADLYASLGEASALDVAGVMQSFTEQSGLPAVSADLECADSAANQEGAAWFRLREDEYRTLDRSSGGGKRWRVPVCVVFDAGAQLGRRCTLLEGAEGRIDLPPLKRCPSFFYANADEAGYYRVRPASAEVTSRALAKLSEAERFGLLDNAWAAVWSGDAPAFSYLDLLATLRQENSRLVWHQVMEALYDVEIALVSDDTRPAFARWLRDTVGPLARRLGWSSKPGESEDRKVMRQEVLQLLGRQGEDPAVVAEAKRIAEQWLARPAQVEGDLARIALRVAVKSGDRALFDRLLSIVKSPKTPEIRRLALRSMAGFERPDLVDATLGLVVDGTLKGQDVFDVLVPLIWRNASARATFEWMKQHYNEMAKVAPPWVLNQVLPRVTRAMCNEEQVRAVDAFLRPRFQQAGLGVKALDEAVEGGLRCALLASRQGAATQAWLASARAP